VRGGIGTAAVIVLTDVLLRRTTASGVADRIDVVCLWLPCVVDGCVQVQSNLRGLWTTSLSWRISARHLTGDLLTSVEFIDVHEFSSRG